MEQPTAVVGYRKLITVGIAGVASVMVQLVVYICLHDLFTNMIILPVLMVLGLVISVLTILKGMREDLLDENGITFKTPFGTKRYPWAAVERYGIENIWTKGHWVPRLRLHLRDGEGNTVIVYREDTARCLRHYCGQPAYNKESI